MAYNYVIDKATNKKIWEGNPSNINNTKEVTDLGLYCIPESGSIWLYYDGERFHRPNMENESEKYIFGFNGQELAPGLYQNNV